MPPENHRPATPAVATLAHRNCAKPLSGGLTTNSQSGTKASKHSRQHPSPVQAEATVYWLSVGVAKADNGDTIAIAGSGTLSVHSKSATGGGTFVHKNVVGEVLATGDWTATSLTSFKAFGSDPELGFPSTFTGGHAVMQVALWVGGVQLHDAILTVDGNLEANPPGLSEGIKLALKDALNFNQKVSGANLFILED